MNKEEKKKAGEELFQKGYSLLQAEPEAALVTSREFLKPLEKAAKYGNPKARFLLGYILTVGYKNIPVDISKGNKILKKCFEELMDLSAVSHDYQAAKFLSEYYRVPLAGHVKDDEKVKRILALSDSYREAELQGQKAENSKPSGQDKKEEEADTTSYDQLVQAIGELKDDGTFDNKERFDSIKASAEKGNMRAAVFLGDAYKEGKYVPQDADTSRLYYEKAEALGSVKAKFMLGQEAVTGDFAKQDIVRGLNRVYQAAKDGYPEAEFFLGKIYAEGKFVEKDLSKAYLYFQAASSRGYEEANDYLKALESEQGDKSLLQKKADEDK
jgi:TPR repeat protein